MKRNSNGGMGGIPVTGVLTTNGFVPENMGGQKKKANSNMKQL